MEEKEVQDLLTAILSSAVNEEAADISIKDKLTPDLLASVYLLAKKHDLAHIVSDFVYRNQVKTDAELWDKLYKYQLVSEYRCERMNRALSVICETLEDANIPYIPLKGAVIRKYYPRESMRTSCDIDILVHEHDLQIAINRLEQKGYRCGGKNYHNVSLYSPNNLHLELHFCILENMDNLDAVLVDAWKYAEPEEGCRYHFTEAFFAFHIFAHMSYHFIRGGCGIRSLMDIWIMEHKMNISYVCAEELLKKAGIYQFAVEMSELAEKCFANKVTDDFSQSLLKYIFAGGVYGCMENNIAVKKTTDKSTFMYAFKRVFLPYKTMTAMYPILVKAPYLLPFCWVVRWIKALFDGKSRRTIMEFQCADNISDNKVAEVKHICSRLGL